MAARILYEFEKGLYKNNILSEKRSFDPIPCLERNLFELAADSNLTSGVFYALTVTVTNDNKSKEGRPFCKTRYRIFKIKGTKNNH